MATKSRISAGFTLIELLVVICILAVLISLSVVATSVVLNTAHANSTEALLKELAVACASYSGRWGNFPPGSIEELGVRAPNDLNTGIESLVACLSSKKGGGTLFQKDNHLSNVDGDSVDRNPTDWYFATKELCEYTDYFGNVIIYFHHKDYEKPRASLTQYQFSAGGEEFKVLPELHPTTKTYANSGRFQLRSVGRDGKPGTGDDLRLDY